MSDTLSNPTSLEMAKALYNFKATVAKTLSFKENEFFIIYNSQTKQRNWWQVINSKAQVGYVPSNYVTAVQVTPQYMMKFLENCISLIEEEPGDGTQDRKDLLLKLIEKRRMIDVNMIKNRSPLPPDFPDSQPKLNITSKVKDPSPAQSPKLFQKKPEVKSETILPKPLVVENKDIKKTVSEIAGQVGVPLCDSRRCSSTPAVSLRSQRSSIASESGISVQEKDINEETVYQLVEQVCINSL